ncbi:MAG: TIGR03905 family TSCPD domain-containing protein [Oscillospiraceae bacterium]
MTINYKTSGVCSKNIELTIENDIIKNVYFEGGCNGNLKGISLLVKGKNAKEIANTLRGSTCGNKSTSCPDQLAKAIDKYYSNL